MICQLSFVRLQFLIVPPPPNQFALLVLHLSLVPQSLAGSGLPGSTHGLCQPVVIQKDIGMQRAGLTKRPSPFASPTLIVELSRAELASLKLGTRRWNPLLDPRPRARVRTRAESTQRRMSVPNASFCHRQVCLLYQNQ